MESKEVSSGLMGNLVPSGIGKRHVQALLMFFGTTIGYAMRVTISVAVVAMTDSSTTDSNVQTYDWDESTRSIILSSFFWGYIVTQVPGGYVAKNWSAQKLLSLGILFCSIFNMIIPAAAQIAGWSGVCACRVGMGIAQGCLMPCMHTLLSKWAPVPERARLSTFAYAGSLFGTVVMMALCGILAASSLGWPSIFYISSSVGIVWAIAFFTWGSDSPALHKSISEDEKRYIQASFGQAQIDTEEEKIPIPWKEIFTSIPMWAIIIAHCTQNWGYWLLITKIPGYMNAILQFNITENGIVSALPYLIMWILSFPASWLSDYALKKDVSKQVARKVSNSIAHWGPALALVGLCYVRSDNAILAVITITAAVGLNAGSICGFQINHIDLSPNFAGTMMSITNCIAAVVAIIVPLVCALIVTDETDAGQWKIVFFLTAAIYFVGNLIFVLFSKAEIQSWNNPELAKVKEER
ncbi:putative inorganic phosphate cotransporter isoform X2 [Cephus cinctus]|uniref:Putative inorganic phosphate cotransporter n=1 Tax=Cephus cinctus TaxID=211228 RepID=A0AAJ7FL74_CEPCN|nr:putative inorganic phosphate cotransporter isoform X2 [Cephus cinctus]